MDHLIKNKKQNNLCNKCQKHLKQDLKIKLHLLFHIFIRRKIKFYTDVSIFAIELVLFRKRKSSITSRKYLKQKNRNYVIRKQLLTTVKDG